MAEPHDDSGETDDVRTIKAAIDRQFRSLEWTDGEGGDWATFAADFHPDATLFPSARPVRPQTVEAFVERMRGLSASALRAFRERMLGAHVRVFGNVAVALASCEITENETETTRAVEALLLVKEDGAWRIVAQTWDSEDAGKPIPDDLL